MRRRVIRRRGRRRIGEGLTHSQAFRRVYPEVGRVDTIHDIKEIIKAIETDDIPNDLKRKRLQFMYSLTFTEKFKKGFKGSIREARRLLKNAYEKYVGRVAVYPSVEALRRAYKRGSDAEKYAVIKICREIEEDLKYLMNRSKDPLEYKRLWLEYHKLRRELERDYEKHPVVTA